MTPVLLTAWIFAAGLLVGLLGWGSYISSQRKRRSSLAFALAGEIAGILRLIETGGWVSYLREIAGKRHARSPKSKTHPFFIPRPVIFETNAQALNLIGPSMAREIAQFHALLGGVSGNAAATVNDAGRAGAALVQLEEALVLADEILRGLKPLLNQNSLGRGKRHRAVAAVAGVRSPGRNPPQSRLFLPK